MVLKILFLYLESDSAIQLLRASKFVQDALWQTGTKSYFAKIIKKLGSQSALWNEVYKIFPNILNKIESNEVKSATRVPLPMDNGVIHGTRCWTSEAFFVIQGKRKIPNQDTKPILTIADLNTFKTQIIPNTRLSDQSFLWKGFILQFVKGDVFTVSKIVTNSTGDISLLQDDVPKKLVKENLSPFQFELCSDKIICWNRTSIVLIDLQKLDSNWGKCTVPSESLSTGIGEFILSSGLTDSQTYARSYTNVLNGAKLNKPTLGVKTLLYEILTLRQIEDTPCVFLRKTQRKLVAVNVDAFSSPPRICSLKWDAVRKKETEAKSFGWDLSSVVTDYGVFNSGKCDQFAFVGPNNTLGIKLEDQDLKIHQVDLDLFKRGENTVHFGNVIIIQNENCNIFCFNLSGQIMWTLDSRVLDHSARPAKLLRSIMIGKKLLLLHGKDHQETVFVKMETGEVVSRVGDFQDLQDLENPAEILENLGANRFRGRLDKVYWLGYRQLSVFKHSLTNDSYFEGEETVTHIKLCEYR